MSLSDEDVQRWRDATALSEGQIRRLHERFVLLDRTHKGRLTRDDLVAIPTLATNPLIDRVLAVMSGEHERGVDFDQLVRAVAVLSSEAGKEDKLQFTFKIYDVDGDGRISNKDLYLALSIMVGANLTPLQLQQIVDKTFIEADADRDGYISFTEFKALAITSDFGDRLNLHF